MTTKAKTGASPLHLDNTELRRELHRADLIIMTSLSLMHPHTQELLKYELADCHVTDASDPLAEDSRLQALHRITPKRDYYKWALLLLILVLGAAWYSVQAENQQLHAQLTQVQGG